MLKLKSIGVVVALSMAMPLGVAETAFAAKKKPEKLTYEQAWARCKVHVDKLAADQQSQRYTRGAACMKMFGYNI
jgi:transposase